MAVRNQVKFGCSWLAFVARSQQELDSEGADTNSSEGIRKCDPSPQVEQPSRQLVKGNLESLDKNENPTVLQSDTARDFAAAPDRCNLAYKLTCLRP
ncbi:unnamed protein product [Protopolystoma xenopodis]|uniref:Uncharacterized protein n=1 Tax=Protopolystoma xenopodis TaxID=117903 RepID=A0A3S5CMW1_9PLAT|nr:unnamed protein product [Protopolystoma xenopodis]